MLYKNQYKTDKQVKMDSKTEKKNRYHTIKAFLVTLYIFFL